MWQNLEIQSTATPLAHDHILAVVAIDCTYSRTGSSRHLFCVVSWCPSTASGNLLRSSWRGSEEQHMYFMFIRVFTWICWFLLIEIIGTNNRPFSILPSPHPPRNWTKKIDDWNTKWLQMPWCSGTALLEKGRTLCCERIWYPLVSR